MSTPSSENPRKPLAERLVQEGLLLAIAAGGPHSLSLREVQRRAEVSPAAAYRHFANRDDLIQAIAEEAAGMLADHIVAAVEDAVASRSTGGSIGARERLRAGCEGYLDFATSNPGLYRTIFYSNEGLDELTAPTERSRGETGDGGYSVLVGLLQGVVGEDRPLHPAEPVVVWSSLHGLATLRLDAALRFVGPDEFAVIRDRVLETIVAAVPVERLGNLAASC